MLKKWIILFALLFSLGLYPRVFVEKNPNSQISINLDRGGMLRVNASGLPIYMIRAIGVLAPVPTLYSTASAGFSLLYPWFTDFTGKVTQAFDLPRMAADDTGPPIVSTFTADTPSTSRDIHITDFSATDDVGVTGYMITESSTAPSVGDANWSTLPPQTYTVTADGVYSLFPWAKDAVGNVSAVFGTGFSVVVDTSAPTVTGFTATSPATTHTISIPTFTATDAVGVTGYMITESSTAPLAGDIGWSGTKPTAHTVTSDGTYSLYPWAKDAVGHVSSVYGSGVPVIVDSTAPVMTNFTATTPTNNLNIPITTIFATDAVGVTGYMITVSSTPPTAGVAGWSGTAPTFYTVGSAGTFTLYPWAKDAVGHVSAVFDSGFPVVVDTTAPSVASFTATTPTNSLNIPITVFTATDNIAVASYMVTSTSTPPAAGASGWIVTAPTSYTVTAAGSYTLYPWAKDTAGNVSAAFATPRAVVVDITTPVVSTFIATTPVNSLTIPITAFTATDNIAVASYIITATSTPPAAGASGWIVTAPTSYTVTAAGSYTLYPWAKDTAGNVSAVFATPRAVVVDITTPTVATFTATTPVNSLNIPITSFTATDNTGVVGYLITTTSAVPAVGAVGWSVTTPTVFTIVSAGSYTLYPWVKDGAGNVSAVFATPRPVVVDMTAPAVGTFIASTPINNLNIPITAFTASDDLAVTGYMVTTSTTPPLSGAAGWGVTAPTVFTVASQGSYTLYPWAKDAAGNVSAVFAAPYAVVVDTTPPSVTVFSVITPFNSLTIPITAFTVVDNIGATGYMVTITSTPPSVGDVNWSPSAPTSYLADSAGTYTLYPWTKDAAGNVSARFGSPPSVILDPVDKEKPSVSWVSPTNDADPYYYLVNRFVFLIVTASDNVSVDKVRIARWDEKIGKYIDIVNLTNPPYEWNLDTNTLNYGWNQIDAIAYDKVGNHSTDKYIFLHRNAYIYLPIITSK